MHYSMEENNDMEIRTIKMVGLRYNKQIHIFKKFAPLFCVDFK